MKRPYVTCLSISLSNHLSDIISNRLADILELRVSSTLTALEQARLLDNMISEGHALLEGVYEIYLCIRCLHVTPLDSSGCRESQPNKGYNLLGHEWKFSNIFYTFYPLWKNFGRGYMSEICWIVLSFVKIGSVKVSLLWEVNELVSILFIFIALGEIWNNWTAQSAVGS